MSREDSISVIIPTYNSERFIIEALKSVLNQTVKPFEIIVVDDGSTDNTREVIESFGGEVQYVYQQKSGVAAARNKGVELARGNLIAFIDADDIWVQNKIQVQLQILQENPGYEMVIGFLKRTLCRENGEENGIDGEKGIFVLHLGSTLIRQSLFEKLGGFDDQMTLSEDIDWFFRGLEKNVKVLIHKEIVQYYRQHDANLTKDKRRTNLYLLKAIKMSLDRRKKSNNGGTKKLPKLNNMDEIMEYWLSG